jgi:hypothetical protein
VPRRLDWLILVFFLVNLLFITYQVDLEQLVIADPYHFTYPLWPPGPVVDAVHWWGSSFDPLVMARPTWWKMTIWIDVLLFGPFYAVAVYVFLTRRGWPRVIPICWAAAMLTVVTVIMGEEVAGPHRTPHLAVVALANAAWVAVPLLVLLRTALYQVHADGPLRTRSRRRERMIDSASDTIDDTT